VECYFCHKKGHYLRECRQRKKSTNQKSEKSAQSAQNCAFVLTDDNSHKKFCTPVSNEQSKSSLDSDSSEVWLLDSGASRHITYRREWFTSYEPITGEEIRLGDDGICSVRGTGTIKILKLIGDQWYPSTIEGVLFVPDIRKNLFSVGVCTSKGYNVVFKGRDVSVLKDSLVVAQGVKQDNGVFRMFFKTLENGEFVNEVNLSTASLKIWHERLGHVNNRTVREMAARGVVKGMKLGGVRDFFCEACHMGKLHRSSFGPAINRESLPGEFIHSDVCGPMSTGSIKGAKFFLTFTDDASGYRQVYFLRHKSDTFEYFKRFECLVSNQLGRKIKVLRTDNGTEYCSREMKTFMANKGIRHETTAPGTPEQNGKAERENRTIVESARTMLEAKNLPKILWAEAVSTAVYVLNRTPSSSDALSTPFEIWFGRKPDVAHLQVFGTTAFTYVDKQFRGKFDSKAERGILVGYAGESPNYRIYYPHKKTVLVSKHVKFDEENLTTTLDSTEETEQLKFRTSSKDVQDSDKQESGAQVVQSKIAVEEESTTDQKKSPVTNSHRMPTVLRPNLRNRSSIKPPSRLEVNVVKHIPKTFKEAMSGSDSNKWHQAVTEELEAHRRNKTWILVPRKGVKTPIDSKWVFKILYDTTGNISRYKARLCARGFRQREGLDYSETFSPVIRYDSLRVFLAVVTQNDLEMLQFDVKTAFLHGDLNEEIFMEIPEGLDVEKDKRDTVCLLQKSLYGLKQASRCWNDKFTKFLVEFGFEQCISDSCIFLGRVENSIVYLALFIDDGLIASKNKDGLKEFKHRV